MAREMWNDWRNFKIKATGFKSFRDGWIEIEIKLELNKGEIRWISNR